MGLFDGWGGNPWGSQGMMGGGSWSPVQGQPGIYQNGNMLANPSQMNGYTPFADGGFYGQYNQNPFSGFGMTGGQQQSAAQGPVNQAGSGSSTLVPQSQYPTTAYNPSPFSSFKSDYGGQAQQDQMQGPAQSPVAPGGGYGASASPFAQFGRFGW